MVHDLCTLALMGFCNSDPELEANENGYDMAHGPSLFAFGNPEAKKTSYQDVDDMLTVFDELPTSGDTLDDDSEELGDDQLALVDAKENEQREDFYNGYGPTESEEGYETGYENFDPILDTDDTIEVPERRTWRSDMLKWFGAFGESPSLKECKEHRRIFSPRGRKKRVERRNFIRCDVYVSA